MKSMFNPSDCRELIDRLDKLTPATPAQWGKMNAAQMLAHAKTPLKVTFGELQLKRTWMGILFGNIAKKKLTGDQPFGRNLPTDKNFIVADQRSFEEEKKALVTLIQRFPQAGPDGMSKDAHPFFGKMTPREWDALTWNHLDHHFRQFGV